MKKLILSAGLIGLLTACATPTPGGAILYKATLPVQADASATGSKVGKACATSILGLVASGDASIEAAKAAGGITRAASVDWSVDSILGIYGTYCTIVTGN